MVAALRIWSSRSWGIEKLALNKAENILNVVEQGKIVHLHSYIINEDSTTPIIGSFKILQ